MIDRIAEAICCRHIQMATGADPADGFWEHVEDQEFYRELAEAAYEAILNNFDGVF